MQILFFVMPRGGLSFLTTLKAVKSPHTQISDENKTPHSWIKLKKSKNTNI